MKKAPYTEMSDKRCGCGRSIKLNVARRVTHEKLLAAYFGIDEAKLDRERRAMLAELRGKKS